MGGAKATKGLSNLHMHHRIITILLPVLTLSANPGELETARSAVKQWVAIEQTLSLEAADWLAKEQLLKDLIEVEAQRIARLEVERSESEAGMSAADGEREALLLREQEALEMATRIEAFLVGIEGTLRALSARLPEPLLNELAAVLKRLPEAGEAMDLSIGERMRTVINLMGRIRQFDGNLHIYESIRELPDGSEAAVRTLYIGLGQAYYLAPSDAGYGKPGIAGWEWKSAPEHADAIRAALTSLDGEVFEPKFVELPVQEIVEQEVSQ